MPINEARGYQRSNLTKQQRCAAEAAVYGLHPPFNPQENPQENMQTNFSPAQLAQMRAILDAHDDGEKRGVIKEFDLNKPPQKPYKYEAFPRLVYRNGKHKPAHDEAALAEALTQGWTIEAPVALQHDEETLDASSAAEAAALDKIARQKKKAA